MGNVAIFKPITRVLLLFWLFRGVEKLVSRQTHTLKRVGSNPILAFFINNFTDVRKILQNYFFAPRLLEVSQHSSRFSWYWGGLTFLPG
jgi:hypothetical protein